MLQWTNQHARALNKIGVKPFDKVLKVYVDYCFMLCVIFDVFYTK